MSLEPATYTLVAYAGGTFYKRLIYRIDDELVDLTGYSAQFIIKEKPGGTTFVTLTDGDGITLGGPAGFIDLEISSTDTATFPWSHGAYELFVTDPTQRKDILLHGPFKIVPF